MPQPDTYTPSHEFVNNEAVLPTLPGSELDIEFNNIAGSIGGILENLERIQDDEGNVIGLTGPTGPTGPVGPSGGPTGATGPTGAPGLPTLTPEQFGAVGDGVTDDLDALTDFLEALIADPSYIGRLSNKTYAIGGSLPNLEVSGVRIEGVGVLGINDDNFGVTIIKALAGCTGTMWTVQPPSGQSMLTGIRVVGVTFDGAGIADTCVCLKTMRHCEFDIQCMDGLTQSLHLDIDTGETAAAHNRISYVGINRAGGVPMRLSGSDTGNWCYNTFVNVAVVHCDDVAIDVLNVDNNKWLVTQTYRNPGAAEYSIVWHGSDDANGTARDEYFDVLSTTVPALAKASGYTYPPDNIRIANIDRTNNCPLPIIESGARLIDGMIRTTTPTATDNSGTPLTSAATTVKHRILNNCIKYWGQIVITTNGAATNLLKIPLPYPTYAGALRRPVKAFNHTTNQPLYGTISAGDDFLLLFGAGATYPGADGTYISFEVEIEMYDE